jgi:hypothetical protein
MIVKKIFPFFIVLGLFTLCLVASSNQLFSLWNSMGFMPERAMRGDLYALTYLRQFKEYDYIEQATLPPANHSKSDIQKNTHLFLMGDSFINSIDKSQYIAQKTDFIRLGVNSKKIQLDSIKKNILIIENIERGIGYRLNDDQYQQLFMGTSGYFTHAIKDVPKTEDSEKPTLLKDFGGNNIEDRLQAMLFNSKIFGLLKESKAALNFNLFERIHGKNIISKDQKSIFYLDEAGDEEVVGFASSFCNLKDERIKEYVKNSEKITQFYQNMGFDEVYFAFVPNKVSIIAPNDDQYNHQIERLQEYQTTYFKTIDIYSAIAGHPEFYHKGDGHWNNKGLALFVRKVNTLLKKK